MCIVGDFNARISNCEDYFEPNDISDHELNLDDFEVDSLSNIHKLDELSIPRNRESDDKKKNNFGNYLLDFCRTNNMYLLNGPLEPGKCTTIKGSVVDYCICTYELLKILI